MATQILVVGGRSISVEDAKNVALYGKLMGKHIYEIKSSKIDDEDPESPRSYGVVSTFVQSVDYVPTEQAVDRVAKIIINGKVTLNVAKNPFKEIDPVKAAKIGFIPEDGYYLDRDGVYALVETLNSGTKARIEADVEKLTNRALALEEIISIEKAGFNEAVAFENALNA